MPWRGGGRQDFRGAEVGHGQKQVGNHCSKGRSLSPSWLLHLCFPGQPFGEEENAGGVGMPEGSDFLAPVCEETWAFRGVLSFNTQLWSVIYNLNLKRLSPVR